jgi:hypothetical protein
MPVLAALNRRGRQVDTLAIDWGHQCASISQPKDESARGKSAQGRGWSSAGSASNYLATDVSSSERLTADHPINNFYHVFSQISF